MGGSNSISVTLSSEMAELVESKVASGEYASESDVVQDGLRRLQADDALVEDWLRREVVATYDSQKADPSRAVPSSDVMQRLERRFAAGKPT